MNSIEAFSKKIFGDPSLLQHLLIALLTVIIAFIIYQGIKSSINLLKKNNHFPEPAASLVRAIIKYAIVIITFFLIMSEFGISAGGFVASLSAIMVMVAIGFVAVWSILSNFFSSFILNTFRPFQAGDEISFPGEDVEGVVQGVGFYYTTLLSDDGFYYQVPNNAFFQKTIKRRPKK